MAVDIATLGIAVDSRQVKSGSAALGSLAKKGGQAEGATKRLERQFKSTSNATSILNKALGVLGAYITAKQVIDYADTWKLLEGRLSLVTKNTAELTRVQNELFSIAQQSRVSFEDTADLYSRMARSTKELGLSQSDMLSVTETINKAIVVSGASSESANAALTQLSQGFASGTLRGEELNSVLEQTPRLAEAIASGMGVTVGELRKLGAAGELTSKQVFNALKSQREAVESEFGKMPITVGQSFTMLSNSILKSIGLIDKATGGSNAFADAIRNMSLWIDANGESIVYAFTYAYETIRRTILVFETMVKTFELGVDGIISVFNDISIGAISTFQSVIDAIIQAPNIKDIIGEDAFIGLINTSGELTVKIDELTLKNRMLFEEMNAGAKSVADNFAELSTPIEGAVAGMMAGMSNQFAPATGATGDMGAPTPDDTVANIDKIKQAYLDLRFSMFSEEDLWNQFANEALIVEDAFNNKIIAEQERNLLLEQLEMNHQKELRKIKNKADQEQRKIDKKNMQFQISMMMAISSAASSIGAAAFSRNKEVQLATATIEGAAAMVKAWNSAPYPYNLPALIATGAGVAAQLSTISSASIGGGGGSIPAGGSGTGGAPTAPASPQLPTDIAEQAPREITVNLGDEAFIRTDAVRALMEAINEEIGDGYRFKT